MDDTSTNEAIFQALAAWAVFVGAAVFAAAIYELITVAMPFVESMLNPPRALLTGF